MGTGGRGVRAGPPPCAQLLLQEVSPGWICCSRTVQQELEVRWVWVGECSPKSWDRSLVLLPRTGCQQSK